MPILIQVMNLDLNVVVIFDLFLFIQKAWRNSQACCTCFKSVSINVINVGGVRLCSYKNWGEPNALSLWNPGYPV